MENIKRIFWAILLCVCLSLVLISCADADTPSDTAPTEGTEATTDAPTLSEPEPDVTADAEPSLLLKLDGAASRVGRISMTVELRDTEEGCTLRFADASQRALEGYTPIAAYGEDGTYTVSDLVLPPDARYILAEGEGMSCLAEIPGVYRLPGNDPFVFGALSDVHYNRYYSNGTDDDALTAFPRALAFFEALEVDFVGVAGDLSVDGEQSALENYNQAIEALPYPVYTVTGNHDVDAVSNGLWEQMINTGIASDEAVVEIAANNLDFVYAPPSLDGDVFIFLSQVRWEYNTPGSTILNTAQIRWLEKQLEQYKDVTVYLFFHTFFCGPDGQGHTGVGNIRNPGGYTYDLPYTYGAPDEKQFRALLQEYRNVVHFSGHSHWMFEMERYGEWANFSSYGGEYAYFVHVPSVTEPRYIGDDDTARTGMNGKNSQGWIIYDYGDVTVLIPVDFLSGVYYTEYMEIIYTK